MAKEADLSDQEILDLASYLCFQDQFSEAIKLLMPYVNKEELNKEILLYFLQIVSYDANLVSIAKQEEYFQKAKENYPKEFCELFSKEKMGVQMLKNYNIKKMYCESCE